MPFLELDPHLYKKSSLLHQFSRLFFKCGFLQISHLYGIITLNQWNEPLIFLVFIRLGKVWCWYKYQTFSGWKLSILDCWLSTSCALKQYISEWIQSCVSWTEVIHLLLGICHYCQIHHYFRRRMAPANIKHTRGPLQMSLNKSCPKQHFSFLFVALGTWECETWNRHIDSSSC